MDETMCLEWITLCKSGMTDITLIGFFSRVDPEMPLQFVSIGRGIGAVGTLIGPLSRVTSHVSLEFRQLDWSIVTFGTPMGLFVGMSVSNMSHQFSGCSECRLTIFASMGSDTSMCVDMILKWGYRFESPLTNSTLMGPLFRVWFHVSRQKVPFVTGVCAIITVMRIPRCRLGHSWWGWCRWGWFCLFPCCTTSCWFLLSLFRSRGWFCLLIWCSLFFLFINVCINIHPDPILLDSSSCGWIYIIEIINGYVIRFICIRIHYFFFDTWWSGGPPFFRWSRSRNVIHLFLFQDCSLWYLYLGSITSSRGLDDQNITTRIIGDYSHRLEITITRSGAGNSCLDYIWSSCTTTTRRQLLVIKRHPSIIHHVNPVVQQILQ